MDNNIYEQYAVIDSKIKALTADKESLRDKILEELVDSETSSVDTTVGKFTISKLKSWTYTEAVEEKAEELKALKASEESCGEATFEEKPSLRFTLAKL